MNVRKYVVLNRPFRIRKLGMLSFWGKYTQDNQERSFSGYTVNVDECEKYTLKELRESRYNFPKFSKKEFDKKENSDTCFYATVDDLEKAFMTKAKKTMIL